MPTIQGSGSISGSERDDVIIGSEEPDIIKNNGGDDVICGLGGEDTLMGVLGNDLFDGGLGNDALWGATGNDSLLEGSVGGDMTIDCAHKVAVRPSCPALYERPTARMTHFPRKN